jgi:hypothetical protein
MKVIRHRLLVVFVVLNACLLVESRDLGDNNITFQRRQQLQQQRTSSRLSHAATSFHRRLFDRFRELVAGLSESEVSKIIFQRHNTPPVNKNATAIETLGPSEGQTLSPVISPSPTIPSDEGSMRPTRVGSPSEEPHSILPSDLITKSPTTLVTIVGIPTIVGTANPTGLQNPPNRESDIPTKTGTIQPSYQDTTFPSNMTYVPTGIGNVTGIPSAATVAPSDMVSDQTGNSINPSGTNTGGTSLAPAAASFVPTLTGNASTTSPAISSVPSDTSVSVDPSSLLGPTSSPGVDASDQPSLVITSSPNATLPPIGNESTAEFLTRTLTTDGSHLVPGTPQNDALVELETNFPDLTPASSQVEILQTYALNTIYFSTNGTGWRVRTGWTGPTPVCADETWYGVFCDSDGLVTNLTLLDNDLLGQLPSEIAGLANLGKQESSSPVYRLRIWLFLLTFHKFIP